MPDVLAPGVVRVDTDTDHTPIGACFGRDKPSGWWWRATDKIGWSHEADLAPLDTWVQCRPPTSPADHPAGIASTGTDDEVLRYARGWRYDENDLIAVVIHRLVAIIDALNAAESSTTPSEPLSYQRGWADAKAGRQYGEGRSSSPVVDREPEKATLIERYAQRLADDPEIQDGVRQIVAALATGDEELIREALGDPVDLDALREKYLAPSVPLVPQPDPDEHRTRVTQWVPHGSHRWVIVPNDWAVDTNVVVRRAGNKEERDDGC